MGCAVSALEDLREPVVLRSSRLAMLRAEANTAVGLDAFLVRPAGTITRATGAAVKGWGPRSP